jgi:DNA-binding NtrC family response regulator
MDYKPREYSRPDTDASDVGAPTPARLSDQQGGDPVMVAAGHGASAKKGGKTASRVGSSDASGDPSRPEWVLGRNPAMARVARSIERAAEVGCTVLILGETGCGKEILARLLHRSGPRSSKPFVPVNCGALSSTLAESQLFGHEKGAFTGADGKAIGIFRAAQGGVVFLDEIGEMPADLQTKLLRVLQQREVHPVGATQPVPIDVQVVAATNRDLQAEVMKGTFREDLYFRLNMIELRIPPLRERPEDIPEFIEFFAKQYAASYRMEEWIPSPETAAEFASFDWPGNVRQLSHVIEQAYVLQMEPELPARTRPVVVMPEEPEEPLTADGKLPFVDLNMLRKCAVKQALEMTRGHKSRAAKLLGVHPNTMTRIIAEIGDDAPTA